MVVVRDKQASLPYLKLYSNQPLDSHRKFSIKFRVQCIFPKSLGKFDKKYFFEVQQCTMPSNDKLERFFLANTLSLCRYEEPAIKSAPLSC
jgi:hypothetical protein